MSSFHHILLFMSGDDEEQFHPLIPDRRDPDPDVNLYKIAINEEDGDGKRVPSRTPFSRNPSSVFVWESAVSQDHFSSFHSFSEDPTSRQEIKFYTCSRSLGGTPEKRNRRNRYFAHSRDLVKNDFAEIRTGQRESPGRAAKVGATALGRAAAKRRRGAKTALQRAKKNVNAAACFD